MDKKVEFIESYIKHGNSDYQWNDNHGELVRCRDCDCGSKRYKSDEIVCHIGTHKPDWFCADGKKVVEE